MFVGTLECPRWDCHILEHRRGSGELKRFLLEPLNCLGEVARFWKTGAGVQRCQGSSRRWFKSEEHASTFHISVATGALNIRKTLD